MSKQQHKWHKEICAKAMGDEVEFKQRIHTEWKSMEDYSFTFFGDDNYEFRIKPQPHKRQALIDAHKNGAEIEFRPRGGSAWLGASAPLWDSDCYEYRIKPTPKEPQYLYVYQSGIDGHPVFRFKPTTQFGNVIGKIKLEDESE